MYRSQDSTIHFVRWIARAFSIVLFLVWGAFFVEHLSWFFGSGERPPANVWLLQAVHLLLLVGLLLALKWEVAGSVLIILSALVFFSQAAGERFLLMYTVTIVPAVLFLVCWWRTRGASPTQSPGKAA
ncbi:MAG: hypothetical protein SF339_01390 [Blastocatellia bacterium]|nr:hypothetical protein [Blastocatellia bacterium]